MFLFRKWSVALTSGLPSAPYLDVSSLGWSSLGTDGSEDRDDSKPKHLICDSALIPLSFHLHTYCAVYMFSCVTTFVFLGPQRASARLGVLHLVGTVGEAQGGEAL